jgi:hypothetical protein
MRPTRCARRATELSWVTSTRVGPRSRHSCRDTRDGLGLGLSIVTAIAAAHDADLRARPLPGGGLEVEVHFPPTPEHPPAAPVLAAAGQAR